MSAECWATVSISLAMTIWQRISNEQGKLPSAEPPCSERPGQSFAPFSPPCSSATDFSWLRRGAPHLLESTPRTGKDRKMQDCRWAKRRDLRGTLMVSFFLLL